MLVNPLWKVGLLLAAPVSVQRQDTVLAAQLKLLSDCGFFLFGGSLGPDFKIAACDQKDPYHACFVARV